MCYQSNLQQQLQLKKFIDLLIKWNKVYNLTAITSFQEIQSLHIDDSLSIVAALPSQGVVVDVGTGAGLPGIPLAIARPDLEFILVDRTLKKINFIKTVVRELGLTNVTPSHLRIENLSVPNCSCCVSRAFASLADYCALVQHLCTVNTRILAMKGKLTTLEKEPIPAGFKLDKIEPLKVNNLNQERHLVYLSLQ